MAQCVTPMELFKLMRLLTNEIEVTHDRKERKCGVCSRRGQVKKKLFVTHLPKPDISLSFVERRKKLPVSDVEVKVTSQDNVQRK